MAESRRPSPQTPPSSGKAVRLWIRPGRLRRPGCRRLCGRRRGGRGGGRRLGRRRLSLHRQGGPRDASIEILKEIVSHLVRAHRGIIESELAAIVIAVIPYHPVSLFRLGNMAGKARFGHFQPGFAAEAGKRLVPVHQQPILFVQVQIAFFDLPETVFLRQLRKKGGIIADLQRPCAGYRY